MDYVEAEEASFHPTLGRTLRHDRIEAILAAVRLAVRNRAVTSGT